MQQNKIQIIFCLRKYLLVLLLLRMMLLTRHFRQRFENETHHDKDLILEKEDQVMIEIDGEIVAIVTKETIQNHQIAFVTDHEVMIVT